MDSTGLIRDGAIDEVSTTGVHRERCCGHRIRLDTDHDCRAFMMMIATPHALIASPIPSPDRERCAAVSAGSVVLRPRVAVMGFKLAIAVRCDPNATPLVFLDSTGAMPPRDGGSAPPHRLSASCHTQRAPVLCNGVQDSAWRT